MSMVMKKMMMMTMRIMRMMQSLLSGSTNLCDECAVSRSRQPICLPPSAPPRLLVSIGYPLFQWTSFVSIGLLLPPSLRGFCHLNYFLCQYVFPHPLHQAYWFLLVTLCFNGLPLFQWTAFYHLSSNIFAIKIFFQLSLIYMTLDIKIRETQCICCTSCPKNILKNCPTLISSSNKNALHCIFWLRTQELQYLDFRHLSNPANTQSF